MGSKIANAIKIHNNRGAVLLTDHKPQSALGLTEEDGQQNRYIIPLFAAATRGRTVVLEKETVLCPSGQVGLLQLLSAWLHRLLPFNWKGGTI